MYGFRFKTTSRLVGWVFVTLLMYNYLPWLAVHQFCNSMLYAR